MWNNGAVSEMTVAAYKKELVMGYQMKEARREKELEIFENFMSKL